MNDNAHNSHKILQVDHVCVLTRSAFDVIAHGVVIPLRGLLTRQIRDHGLATRHQLNRTVVLLRSVLLSIVVEIPVTLHWLLTKTWTVNTVTHIWRLDVPLTVPIDWTLGRPTGIWELAHIGTLRKRGLNTTHVHRGNRSFRNSERTANQSIRERNQRTTDSTRCSYLQRRYC